MITVWRLVQAWFRACARAAVGEAAAPALTPPWPPAAGVDGAAARIDPVEGGIETRQMGERLVFRWDTLSQPGYEPQIIDCPTHRGRKALMLAKIVPLAGLTEQAAQALLAQIAVCRHNALSRG